MYRIVSTVDVPLQSMLLLVLSHTVGSGLAVQSTATEAAFTLTRARVRVRVSAYRLLFIHIYALPENRTCAETTCTSQVHAARILTGAELLSTWTAAIGIGLRGMETHVCYNLGMVLGLVFVAVRTHPETCSLLHDTWMSEVSLLRLSIICCYYYVPVQYFISRRFTVNRCCISVYI